MQRFNELAVEDWLWGGFEVFGNGSGVREDEGAVVCLRGGGQIALPMGSRCPQQLAESRAIQPRALG